MDYFDLVKGSTGDRSSEHEDTFGDLLRECRESNKKKVNEREPELDTERPEKPRPKSREEEPDPDAPPEPPDEVKEPEQPMEMRKEYLGKTEDTHYYFITTEGGEGIIDDFVIVDQEGVKKYSAKDRNIEVTEEKIADFLIQAIRDVQIAQIERSIFMKHIYPKLIEEEPEEEEEIIEEPEEEEKSKKEKPLAPEEEEPLESKKITDSVDEKKLELSDGIVILDFVAWDMFKKTGKECTPEEYKEVKARALPYFGYREAHPEFGADESKTDEKKKPPTCKKCNKAHWPFKKCSEAKINEDELKAGDKVFGIYADIEGVIVRQTGEDDPEFDRLVDEYSEKFGVPFFETTPTPEPPFYIVNVDGEEELFGDSELMVKGSKTVEEISDKEAQEIQRNTHKSRRRRAQRGRPNRPKDSMNPDEPGLKRPDKYSMDSADKKSKGPKKYTEEEQWDRRKKDHDVIVGDGTDEKCNKKVKENHLIEMKVTDDEGNEFDVLLMNSDEPTADDTAIEINGTEFKFSRDFVTMWTDDEGELSEEGLRELALDALANLEEEELSELIAKGAEQEVADDEEKEVDDVEEPAPEMVDEPAKDEEEAPGEGETTDDVDMSVPGPIKPQLKYRPKKKAEVPQQVGPEEELGNPFEGKDEVTENSEEIEQELDVLDQMSIGELRDVVGEEAERLPEKNDLIDAVMHKKFGDKYVKYCKRQVGLEKKDRGSDIDEINERYWFIDIGKTYRIKGATPGSKNTLPEGDYKIADVSGAPRAVPLKNWLFQVEGDDTWWKLGLHDFEEIEKKNNERDNDMIEKKTPEALLKVADAKEKSAKALRDEAKALRDNAAKMAKKEKAAAKKDEGINPKPDDSEETKKKKLAEEEELNETDVAKGAKALIQLAKDALKAAEYSKAAEYCAKLAEIEAVVPSEAEAEVKKEDKPEKDEKPEDKPDENADENADEEILPEVADENADSEVVEAKKDKDDKKAKAKKDKEEKEEKAKKDKKEKEAKAKVKKDKKDKAKKESKIEVESTEDITERKSEERLIDLLGMNS